MKRIWPTRVHPLRRRRREFSNTSKPPKPEAGTKIKISEKYAVKSGLKPVAIRRQATTECFIRRAAKKPFLMKNSGRRRGNQGAPLRFRDNGAADRAPRPAARTCHSKRCVRAR